MLLSESYKKRLQKLAGILTEATQSEREIAFAASDERVPFDTDLMTTAILQGREVGLYFQSNNEKYKMPVTKARIIYPVAMGTSTAGNQVVRALHKMGQSESEAIKTGVRSAEVDNEWRLLKVENIKGMWFTGNFFRGPIDGYNPNDKGMTNVNVSTNFTNVRRFQDDLFKKLNAEKNKKDERDKMLKTFKETGERPVEQPINTVPIEQDIPEETPEETGYDEQI